MQRTTCAWWVRVRAALAAVLMLTWMVPSPQAATRDDEPRWEQLTAAERRVLEPLQHEWPSIDATRKQKWRELAAQFPRLPPDRQELLSSRMKAWARMSPTERTTARLRYQEAKQISEAERQARWQSYQSLPEDKRKALADQAQHRVVPAQPAKPAASGLAEVQPKSNIATPRPTTPPTARAVAPGTVRAAVGASTRPIDERPTPARHPQSTLPKIVASPEFVDRSTLLPRRDAQGATAVPTAEREQATP
jgi:hypothetical protein